MNAMYFVVFAHRQVTVPGELQNFDALFEDGWIQPGFVCTSGVFFDDLLEAFSLTDSLETST